MKKSVKTSLITAGVLIVLGVIVFVCALAAAGFDFKLLSTQKLQSATHGISQDFESISVDVEFSDILFILSDGGTCRVECLEDPKVRNSVKVQDNVLIIKAVDERKWYDQIGINFQSPSVTIYLPRDVYAGLDISTEVGNIEIPNDFSFETLSIESTTSSIFCSANISRSISIKTTTGDINVSSNRAETVKLSSTTGNMVLGDIECNDFSAGTTTGNIKLQNVVSQGALEINAKTGNVTVVSCDGAKIKIETSTGHVKGTLLSDKIFITDTQTGRVEIPKTTAGGVCEIITSTGNIEIEIG